MWAQARRRGRQVRRGRERRSQIFLLGCEFLLRGVEIRHQICHERIQIGVLEFIEGLWGRTSVDTLQATTATTYWEMKIYYKCRPRFNISTFYSP